MTQATTPNPAPNSQNPAPRRPAKSRKKPSAGRRPRRVSQSLSAEEKARAVLAAWTERLSQSEICRQLQINYMTFQNWQKRAMEGMLQALEDHARLSEGAALSPRLRKLMEKQGRARNTPALEQRLKALQESDDRPAKA